METAYEMVLKEKPQDITNPLLSRYIHILKEIFGDDLKAVAVFGSLARGTAKFPGSDIDLLIVVEGMKKLSFGERLKATMKAEDKLSKTVEYAKFKDVFGWTPGIQEVILTPEELKAHPPILLDLTTDALILYDKGVLSEELDRLRKRLRELGAKKNQAQGFMVRDIKAGCEAGGGSEDMNTRLMAMDYIKRVRGCFKEYEAELRPASDIFSKEDAEEALASTEEVFEACNRLIKEIFDESPENQD